MASNIRLPKAVKGRGLRGDARVYLDSWETFVDTSTGRSQSETQDTGEFHNSSNSIRIVEYKL
jgi:hypothetical protein